MPVLNTQESKEYRELVRAYKMGYNCQKGEAEDLADKRQRLIEDDKLRIEMEKNARKCAEEKYDRANLHQKLINTILE